MSSLVPSVPGEPRTSKDSAQEAAIPRGALASINPAAERLFFKHYLFSDPGDDWAIASTSPALHGAGADAKDRCGIAAGDQGRDGQEYSCECLDGIARAETNLPSPPGSSRW